VSFIVLIKIHITVLIISHVRLLQQQQKQKIFVLVSNNSNV